MPRQQDTVKVDYDNDYKDLIHYKSTHYQMMKITAKVEK